MEAEQEDFDKSMDNLTKHCNAYAPTIFKTPALQTYYLLSLILLVPCLPLRGTYYMHCLKRSKSR
jgi:hypothetical protein